MCESLKYLARFSAIASGEMDEIRARIVSVAEIFGANGNVDKTDTVERLTGTVLVSNNGTPRSVDRANDASSLFGFSDTLADEVRGSGTVEWVSWFDALRIESFNEMVVTRAVGRDDGLSLLFDGNLKRQKREFMMRFVIEIDFKQTFR